MNKDSKTWRLSFDERGRAFIVDPLGVVRFKGGMKVMARHFMLLMQESDHLQKESQSVAERISRAIGDREYDDKAGTIVDRATIKTQVDNIALDKQDIFIRRSPVLQARIDFIDKIIKELFWPVQRAASGQLSHEEAARLNHYCPACRIIHYDIKPKIYYCRACHLEGYDCCVNKDTGRCDECEEKHEDQTDPKQK